jgi:hypothetical protein
MAPTVVLPLRIDSWLPSEPDNDFETRDLVPPDTPSDH